MENLKELSFEEMQEVGGGWGVLLGGAALFMAWDMMMNPGETIETIKNGFNRGYEDGKNNLKTLSVLNNEELILIDGGGLAAVTRWFVDGVSYVVGRIAAHEGIPASQSALLGPNARPTM